MLTCLLFHIYCEISVDQIIGGGGGEGQPHSSATALVRTSFTILYTISDFFRFLLGFFISDMWSMLLFSLS